MEYNYYKLTKILKSVHYVLLGVIVMLTSLAGFFAFKWYSSVHSDIAYFVSDNATHVAHKIDKGYSISRYDFEIQNFASGVLEKAFSHNEYTLDENLKKAISVMDSQSGLYFLNKFDEQVEELYKKYNAISTVTLESIETNMKRYPYEVLLNYKTNLHFPKGENILKDSESRSGLYFEVECIERSELNPYGMLIVNLRFVNATNNEK